MRARTMSAIAIMLTLGMGLAGLAGTTRAQGSAAPPATRWKASDQGTKAPGAPGMREHEMGEMDMDEPGMGGPGTRGSGMRGPGMRGPGMREHRMEMMRELDLSKDQRERIADLREKQERTNIRMRADLQTARLDLRRLMRAVKADRMAINRQIDRMAQLRADMHKARVGMMLDMRGVLTPEQQERARERMDH